MTEPNYKFDYSGGVHFSELLKKSKGEVKERPAAEHQIASLPNSPEVGVSSDRFGLASQLQQIESGQMEAYELQLDAMLEMGKMQKIPANWIIDGDMTVDCGLFVEGRISGKVLSRGNVVVLARGAEILGGIICDTLISCGTVGGDIIAEQIIVGDDGVIDAQNVHVAKGKLLTCPGSEFSGKVHSL